MAGIVQPTLEQAQPSCWVIRAAGSLKSGLALTPGSDPESASSFPAGGFVLAAWSSCLWPVAVRSEELAVALPTPRLTKRERLAGPSVPSLATPHSWLDLTPRFSQRAERRGVCIARGTTHASIYRAAVMLIEIDSISLIGPQDRQVRQEEQAMRYFAHITEKGPVKYADLPGSIGVHESLDNHMPIGIASCRTWDEKGLGVWTLRIGGQEIPGGWAIIDREFVQIA